MTDFSIPVHIEERSGINRVSEPIRIGVPLPRGLVYEASAVMAATAGGEAVPLQARPLARWGDRSIKWLLVDAIVSIDAMQRTTIVIGPAVQRTGPPRVPELRIDELDGSIDVDTGAARFTFRENAPGPLVQVVVDGARLLDDGGARLRMTDARGTVFAAIVAHLTVEERGPVRATIAGDGCFGGPDGGLPVTFTWRAALSAGASTVSLDLQLRNPQAAVHMGGLWDLGDPGSYSFRDLTLSLRPRFPANALRWYDESPACEREHAGPCWTIYQDSSGGERWDSINHVDRRGQPTVAFRGYRVTGGGSGCEAVISGGDRATPAATVVGPSAWVAATVADFWQNFPKALRWRHGALDIALFPGETTRGFELQAGERKRHTMLLDFGVAAGRPQIAARQHPVDVSVDPGWIEHAEAIAWFTAASDDDEPRYRDYVGQIVAGPQSFAARREIIDEYGWRNFGDLYADHEAVHHRGPEPFISHYNNQYDFVYGAFVHFARSGDARWRRLMEDAARHLIDIDIYHTDRDRALYNGGLFWHTDHYVPAGTCTHRTYSRRNRSAADYGGGPSNEHNYTSGLLHYYYISGDREAADAVRELAEWVLAMDDGSRTLFGLIDGGPTGEASRTLAADYHHPGRGAGNSINALIDAHSLTGERRFLAKAEALIQRCIHPHDGIAALGFADDPEHRWSYLVFLQVLGKYLAKKLEIGETDYAFHHARESLLAYAGWMAEHEVPYKDVLERVEIPTETWPAHDVRKAQVLYIAAGYAPAAAAARFRERAAFFFDRCLEDLLGFPTAHLTRPLVILCVYGSTEPYLRTRGNPGLRCSVHSHVFAPRPRFQPQSARVRAAFALKLRVARAELWRIFRDRLGAVAWPRRRSFAEKGALS